MERFKFYLTRTLAEGVNGNSIVYYGPDTALTGLYHRVRGTITVLSSSDAKPR